MFLSSLNLDSAVTNFAFSRCIPGSLNLLYILISQAHSTLFNTAALNEDLSLPCRRADLFQAIELTAAGMEEGNLIDSVLRLLPSVPLTVIT